MYAKLLCGLLLMKVKFAIQCARRDSPVSGSEAIALAALLQFAEGLQSNVKSAIKQDADWYQRFMPLTEVVVYSSFTVTFYLETDHLCVYGYPFILYCVCRL